MVLILRVLGMYEVVMVVKKGYLVVSVVVFLGKGVLLVWRIRLCLADGLYSLSD